MRVLVDVRWAGLTGIGRYYSEILNRVPSGIDVVGLKGNYEISNPFSPLFLRDEIIRSECDFFWSPGFMPPAPIWMHTKNPRIVITLHDLIHLKYHSFVHRLYYNLFLKYCFKRCSAIITDSGFSKKEILDWAGIDSRKVRVAHLGVDKNFSADGAIYKLDKPYMLYVGNHRRHKNILNMMSAFSRIVDVYDGYLLFSGDQNSLIDDYASDLSISDRIKYAGKIDDDNLPAVYRGADILLYLSLLEGFGLPPLEAMSSGVPALVSNRASIPEVVGDAALLVDPENVDEISIGMKKIIFNKDFTEQIVRKGLMRANDFQWDKTAKIVWDTVLNEL